ncbi:hypothetical protein E6C27_scaffold345G00270 [Cucumis melo var. makuwa]|uniref:Uncharacterized protein n=1 Tax=Cucumis melo var. makuwa TaxID=1194695 RepID=A0A5A7TBN8_CUCMM|nr:hypothetical protein E6C27_scaffold345G00270 [Cucumis melo var. makuwa]
MAATLEEEINEHKDKNDSSKSDCHWKRPLKKASVSGDDPDGRGSSALGVSDVPPLSPLNDHLEGRIELDSDESLMGPHVVDSAIKKVGTSKTSISKPAKQSLRPSALLKEIRRGKMTVEGKDIGSPPSKGDVCPKVPLQKVNSTHAPLKFSESPLDTSNRQTMRNPEPSQWVGENVVSNFFKKTAFCVWEDIQDKIMRIPFEYIPRLRPEIATILSGIENIHADGFTPLDEYLNNYLKRKAEAIDQQELEVAKLQDEVNTLESTPTISEEAIEILATKAEAIDQQELKVAKLQDEVNTLESTPSITEEAIEILATVCRSMEAAREEFKNFKWKL